MKSKSLKALALGAVGAMSILPMAAPAGSQANSLTLTHSPTEGPVGTVITYSGSGCSGTRTPPEGQEDGRVILLYRNFANSPQENFTADAEGNFSGSLVVPDDADFFDPSNPPPADRTYPVAVQCWVTEDEEDTVESEAGGFTITEAPATTTTVQPATTTTTAAARGTTTSTATVSPSSVRPGQQVVVTGGGFAPNTSLVVDLFSSPVRLGTTTSDAAGNYSVRVTIPADAAPGPHEIVVSGRGANGQPHKSVGNVTVLRAAGAAVPVRAKPTFTG